MDDDKRVLPASGAWGGMGHLVDSVGELLPTLVSLAGVKKDGNIHGHSSKSLMMWWGRGAGWTMLLSRPVCAM